VTLKAYTGTHDVFRINGYGYAAEGSTEKDSEGYNRFYAYDVKAGKHDLCSFAWTRSDIVYIDGDPAKGIDYNAKVPFKWRMDELPYHCKCEFYSIFDLGGDSYTTIDQWGQPQLKQNSMPKS
jgi:hypothetical protein